jgi:hypothetical protein
VGVTAIFTNTAGEKIDCALIFGSHINRIAAADVQSAVAADEFHVTGLQI